MDSLPPELRLNVKGARISTIYKVLDPDKPAYTVISSGGGGTYMYHWKGRALTDRERAALQTFPHDFEFVGGHESVRKQIGMAVPPEGAAHRHRSRAEVVPRDPLRDGRAEPSGPRGGGQADPHPEGRQARRRGLTVRTDATATSSRRRAASSRRSCRARPRRSSNTSTRCRRSLRRSPSRRPSHPPLPAAVVRPQEGAGRVGLLRLGVVVGQELVSLGCLGRGWARHDRAGARLPAGPPGRRAALARPGSGLRNPPPSARAQRRRSSIGVSS